MIKVNKLQHVTYHSLWYVQSENFTEVKISRCGVNGLANS